MTTKSSSADAQDIQRARNIAVGADVKPSTGKLFAYRGSSAYIPNYWNIESEGYTDTGFSISGYIHDDDAAFLVLAANSHHAMKEALEAVHRCGNAGARLSRDASDKVRAALSRLTKEI